MPSDSERRGFKNILVLGFVSCLTDISSEMIYPLLPLYMTIKLGVGPSIVGLVEGIAESLASLLRVGSGYLSDKIGRRKPLAIGGYSCSTIGKVLFYFSTTWLWVLSGRIVDRFGKGIRTAPRDALIAESSKEESRGRSFGLHRALDTSGAVVGATLAFVFLVAYHGDYRKVFLVSLIPAAGGVALLFLAKEMRRGRVEGKKVKLEWSKLDRRLRRFLLIIFFFSLGNSSNQFLVLRAKNLGFTVDMSILLYVTFNVVHALTSYPLGGLSDKIGRRKMLVFGYAAYGLVYLGFALTPGKSFLWGLFPAYGLYLGATEGVEKAFLSDMAPGHLKATVIGLHATLVGTALLPASILAGVLWSWLGPAATFLFGSAAGLLAALALWTVR